MTERSEAEKMSQYELELKLDRMTQRAFGNGMQKPPKKPLSVVDAEVIKEYQKQFNQPVREYEMEIDEETGEERIKLDDKGEPVFKVVAKKFRVVPPPELDVVEEDELHQLPTKEQLKVIDLEMQKAKLIIKQRQQDLKDMLELRKQAIKLIDDLPTPVSFINEELPSGRFVMRPNPNYERQKLQVEQEKERRIARVNDIDDNLERVKAEINDMKDEYDGLNIELSRVPEFERENAARISKVKQINSERVKAYQETLNLMNRGAFQQDKMPNESEEDYLARLQANAEEEYVDETLFEAEIYNTDKFKENLKKLVRDDVKIEQVSNRIVRDDKEEILKKFPLFKKKFTELYGVNNPAVKASDIITFIEAFIKSSKGDDALLNYLGAVEEEKEPEYTVEMAENDRKKVLIMTNPVNNRKLYWRLGEYFDDKGNENLVALYSLTGKRESYDEYNTRKVARLIKDATGITSAYIKEFFNNKPIPVVLQGRIAPSSEYDLNYPIAKVPTGREDEDGMIYKFGWGVKEEVIPEMVDFGKIKLALHKLFYKNTLSARHKNLGRIAGFPNVKVSDDLVSIIMKLSKGQKVIKQEIDALTKTEQILYDKLLSLANLHKNAPNNKDNTIVALKERMDLIGGQIEAGNDNKLLVKELYHIVHALKNFGVISNKEATKFLSQF
jgi:hypothetical protein